jgi:isoleucyl-tRNA synthetase
VKDRLYVEAGSQSAARPKEFIDTALADLLISPITALHCEEVWKYIPKLSDENPDSVVFQRCRIKKMLSINSLWNGGRIHEIRDPLIKFRRLKRLKENANHLKAKSPLRTGRL